MTGPEHYREAEKRATAARNEADPQWALIQAQLATVHAMLAQTAATAAQTEVLAFIHDVRHTTVDAWTGAIEGGAAGA